MTPDRSITPAHGAQGSPPDALEELAGLVGIGRFAQALTVLRHSGPLHARLFPEESAAVEALLLACQACDADAKMHHEAVARAVEREHELGQHLNALSAHLMGCGVGSDAAAGPEVEGLHGDNPASPKRDRSAN